ncbi:MAG: tRNA (adenosine(37)-N6)-threonylcarbamoyltransferase complex ATPase subunit type 1 TsaE [Campylobacterales bacterium]|nr:tRNA (adenosine(37)-N6)-threonylcarbamoyltransferase complex ATPase subunit type 1 TsaE [Campylobacterales bacterium]
MREFRLQLNNLNPLFEYLDTILKPHSITMLQGDLASGKTTLVREYLKFKNIDENVTSPTFSLYHEYKNGIFHYDIYNKELNEILELGFLELFEQDGIHFVEWGDDRLIKILKSYGFFVVVVTIEPKDDCRVYKVSHE